MNNKGNKVCCWILGGIGVFILLSMLGTGLIITALVAKGGGENKAAVKNNSYLVYDLSGVLNDHSAEPNLQFWINKPVTLSDILYSLKLAATDDRIKGIILRPMGVAGFAEIREVRTAVQNFRKSGKPVYAYLEIATDRDYYLASVADSIIMAPARSGGLTMLGLSVESTYWAKTFEKVGIKFYALHVGQYKGAFENYSADHMSAPLRESLQSLLDDMYKSYTSDISASRPKLTPAVLDEELLRGKDLFITGPEAVEKGYADLAQDWGDFREHLKGGEKELNSITPAKYVKGSHHMPGKGDGKKEIAVLFAEGEISFKRDDGGPLDMNEGITAGEMVKQLRELKEDDDVAAVVLRVNSPGGSAYASEVILQEVLRLKAKKPVVVSMGNVAASGGYYISCAADRIIAQPNTITGSIGVVSLFPSAEELYKKIGANVEVVERGKWASYFRVDRDLTEEQRGVLISYMGQIYDEFVGRVADGRKLEVATVAQVAEGRVWTGAQALDRKLVDELGGMDLAISRARELAKLGEDAPVNYYPREKDIFSFIVEHFNTTLGEFRDGWLLLPQERELRRALAYLNDFLTQRDFVQAVLPINLP